MNTFFSASDHAHHCRASCMAHYYTKRYNKKALPKTTISEVAIINNENYASGYGEYKEYVYKKANDLSITLEAYTARQAGGPVVVNIHGGALTSGDRGSMNAYFKESLIKAGVTVVSINYRLAPETKLPYIIEDVRDALEWVRKNGAAELGCDPARLGVTGGSAGGYLTLMAGTFEVKPKALVSIYGYGDILGDWYCKPDKFYCSMPLVSETDAMKRIGDKEREEGNSGDWYLWTRQNGMWTSLVSGYDIHRDRAVIEKYCPILNIDENYPPTMLLHGDNDTDVPYGLSVDMYNALKEKGLTVELLTRPGGGHGFDYDYDNPDIRTMLDKAVGFMLKHI